MRPYFSYPCPNDNMSRIFPAGGTVISLIYLLLSHLSFLSFDRDMDPFSVTDSIVASLGPNQTLIPSDPKLAAQVSSFSYFAQTELFIPAAYAGRIFRNVYPYHKGVFSAIVDGINGRLAALDKQLQGSTWLVGERVTLADVFVGSALAFAFGGVISAADRKKVPNVVRYYETYVMSLSGSLIQWHSAYSACS